MVKTEDSGNFMIFKNEIDGVSIRATASSDLGESWKCRAWKHGTSEDRSESVPSKDEAEKWCEKAVNLDRDVWAVQAVHEAAQGEDTGQESPSD